MTYAYDDTDPAQKEQYTQQAPVSPNHEGNEANDEADSNYEDFFDDAPDEFDEQGQSSRWRQYIAWVAQKLYVPEIVDYGRQAYQWVAERARSVMMLFKRRKRS